MTGNSRTYALVTLGCKANQYDSAALASDFARRGLRPAPLADADLVVVSGCAVTASSASQGRREVRRARRANPAATIAVAGCLARADGEGLAAMEEVGLVLRGGGAWPADPAVAGGRRSRPLLKVQDGCDRACSYCLVPSLRGIPRSLPPGRAVAAVGSLMGGGAGEVALTGIHLGLYGADLSPRSSLEELLGSLLATGLSGRVRLSSLDPTEVTDPLLNLIAGAGGRICRHLHLTLQSGSDRVLAAMNRRGSALDFSSAVTRARTMIPGVGLGCDLIVGFPGESEGDFCASREAVEGHSIPFLHAFPFSPRPGTAAAALPDDVPPAVKRERVRRLQGAALANRIRFLAGFPGQTLPVVLEGGRDRATGRRVARADNYLVVLVVGAESIPRGRLAEARITGVGGESLLGEVS